MNLTEQLISDFKLLCDSENIELEFSIPDNKPAYELFAINKKGEAAICICHNEYMFQKYTIYKCIKNSTAVGISKEQFMVLKKLILDTHKKNRKQS